MRNLLLLILLIAPVLTSCAVGEASRKQAFYHYQMGLSYLGENNITSALVELVEAEKLAPDDPQVLNSLGWGYFLKNQYELAEQKFLRAIALKPDFTEAKNNLGLNYMAMNRWDDAIRQFKIVAADIFYPGQENAQINMGRSYFGKGDYNTALSTFRSVVTANPGNPIARLDLGRVYLETGKTEIAISEFKRAAALDAGYAKAYYFLGLAYMKIKDHESAKASFNEAIRLAPDLEIGYLSRENLEKLK